MKEGSHLGHAEFFKTACKLDEAQQTATPDHYMFAPDEAAFWARFPSRPLHGSAGSLFLWDSRTAHSVSTCQHTRKCIPNTCDAQGQACKHHCCYSTSIFWSASPTPCKHVACLGPLDIGEEVMLAAALRRSGLLCNWL